MLIITSKEKLVEEIVDTLEMKMNWKPTTISNKSTNDRLSQVVDKPVSRI